MKINVCNYHTSVDSCWGPRTLRDHELIYVVSGICELSAGENCKISAGETVVIRPGEEHIFRSLGRSTISCIHCEPEPELAGSLRYLRPSPEESERLHQLFRACADEFPGNSPERNELLACMVREIWLRLRRAAVQPQAPSRLLRAITAYIRENLTAAELGRSDFAAYFGVTPQYINLLFRKELHLTPSEYVNRQRVYRAYRLLLEDGLSVKEAAAAVGYNDSFYFSKIFKRLTGRTPGGLRNKN